MSRQVVVKKRCDLDPNLDADVTVSLTYKGTIYTTDLCKKHAEDLDGFLAPLLKAAFQKDRMTKSRVEKYTKDERDLARAWAKDQGIPVTGRLSGDVIEAYKAANSEGLLELGLVPRVEEVTKEWHRKSGEAARSLAIPDPEERARVRAWATEQGYTMGRAGIIPREIQDAYYKSKEAG